MENDFDAVIQQEVLPQVFASAHSQFDQMNSQFSSSIAQASNLFDNLQTAVSVLNDQHQVLHQATVESVAVLQNQNSELLRLRHAQSVCETAVGQGHQQIQAVSQASEQQSNMVNELRNDVESGFSRTANVLSQHEDRIRAGPRLPVTLTEPANIPWWPSQNSSMPNVSPPVMDFLSDLPVPTTVPSRDCAFPPPKTVELAGCSSKTAFEEKQFDILDSLAANNRNAVAPSYTNFKVSPAPAFNCERYGTWRQELVFWRELYFYVPDLHLLSILGSHSDSSLKQLLIKFHHQTREVVSERTLSNFVRMLDEYYLVSSQERELKQLDRLMELKKFPSETMVGFWLRYEKILSTLDGSSSHLSPSFLFIRAFKSLDLSTLQRTSIMTFLECQSLEHTWQNLKKSTIKLFCLYGSSNAPSNVKGSHVVHQSDSQDKNETFLSDDDQIFAIRRGKGKGGRNRPNMEQMAIRRTQDAMNLKNQIFAMDSAGKGGASKGVICYRCGATDHTLRNCPLPYTPVLAYAPSRGKDGKLRSTMLADTLGDPINSEDKIDIPSELTPENVTDETNPMVVSQDVGVLAEDCCYDPESAWVSQWLDQVHDVEEIAVCEVVDSQTSLSVLHTKTDLMSLSTPQLLIDSGASASVAGREWIKQWLLLAGITTFPVLQPSDKVFRFGNMCTYASAGIVHLNGRVISLSPDGKQIPIYLSFAIDIVELDLPFLLPRQALSSMESQIDFSSNELVIPHLGDCPWL